MEERFSDDDHTDFHENWVMIRHTDNTIVLSIHLTQNSAVMEIGDTVQQSQQIGLSGNSGASNGPHHHFDVRTYGSNLPPGYNRQPCGMTLPVSFHIRSRIRAGSWRERPTPQGALRRTPADQGVAPNCPFRIFPTLGDLGNARFGAHRSDQSSHG